MSSLQTQTCLHAGSTVDLGFLLPSCRHHSSVWTTNSACVVSAVASPVLQSNVAEFWGTWSVRPRFWSNLGLPVLRKEPPRRMLTKFWPLFHPVLRARDWLPLTTSPSQMNYNPAHYEPHPKEHLSRLTRALRLGQTTHPSSSIAVLIRFSAFLPCTSLA